jgi:type VI secretion system secreted protein VgrG
MPSADPSAFRVTYEFSCPAASGAQWRVVGFRLREELGAPFVLRLDLIHAMRSGVPDPMELWGQDCRIVLSRGDIGSGQRPVQRVIAGHISRVEQGNLQDPYVTCSIRVVPALSLLAHNSNSRIFQNKKVPEIVSDVLGEGLKPYGNRQIEGLQNQADYPTREYTVQYQESDRDFALRLLEQEGIFFRFDHDASGGEKPQERLVLVDNTDGLPQVDPLPFGGQGDVSVFEAQVSALEYWAASTPTHVAVRDYNWTNPSFDAAGESGSNDRRGQKREVFHYQQGTAIADYDEPAYRSDDAARQAMLREEEHRSQQHRARGESNSLELEAGCRFELTGHPLSSMNQEYLVVAVDHEGTADMPGADEGGDYGNTFFCIPASAPFRPPRATPAPRMYGCQVATVVGPSGEEIHTDRHGRVRVRFPWDRSGAEADECSCWIRVAQSWAGPQFGASFIPRVGMDVVVHFEEGDPDRPLVTGCVYNGVNLPPVELPQDKTQSSLTTRSSPDGSDQRNELVFEDKKGAELVRFRAEKDLNATVGDKRTLLVLGEEDYQVEKHQEFKVLETRTKTVVKDETSELQANRIITIGETDTVTVTKDRTTTVNGDVTQNFNQNHTQNVENNQVVKVKQGKQEDIGTTYNILADKAFVVKQGGSEVSLAFVAGSAELNANEQITFRTGRSSMTLTSDGTIELQGVTIMVRGNDGLQMVGNSASVTLDQNGNITKGKQFVANMMKKFSGKAGKIELG